MGEGRRFAGQSSSHGKLKLASHCSNDRDQSVRPTRNAHYHSQDASAECATKSVGFCRFTEKTSCFDFSSVVNLFWIRN
jgi:hypothetical protein